MMRAMITNITMLLMMMCLKYSTGRLDQWGRSKVFVSMEMIMTKVWVFFDVGLVLNQAEEDEEGWCLVGENVIG